MDGLDPTPTPEDHELLRRIAEVGEEAELMALVSKTPEELGAYFSRFRGEPLSAAEEERIMKALQRQIRETCERADSCDPNV